MTLFQSSYSIYKRPLSQLTTILGVTREYKLYNRVLTIDHPFIPPADPNPFFHDRYNGRGCAFINENIQISQPPAPTAAPQPRGDFDNFKRH